MAWTSITITRDSGNPSICTGAAKYNDATYGEFTFSKTVTYNAAGQNTFVADANAAKTAWLTRRAGEVTVEQQVLAALNA